MVFTKFSISHTLQNLQKVYTQLCTPIDKLYQILIIFIWSKKYISLKDREKKKEYYTFMGKYHNQTLGEIIILSKWVFFFSFLFKGRLERLLFKIKFCRKTLQQRIMKRSFQFARIVSSILLQKRKSILQIYSELNNLAGGYAVGRT